MFGIWYPHVYVVSEKGTKQSQNFGCFRELLKKVLFFEFCLKNICVYIYIYIYVNNLTFIFFFNSKIKKLVFNFL